MSVGIWGIGNRQADGATGHRNAKCPIAQTLLVDPTVAPVIQSAADQYGASLAKDCRPIAVEARASKDIARNGLGAAAGWVPEDVIWQSKATDTRLAAAPQQILGWSPITVVAPNELAQALDGRPLTGQTLTDLTTSTKTFSDYGHPSWGRFKLVLPAPADSPTGAAGFSSLARQVGGGQDFPVSAASATDEQRKMPGVQWRTVAQPSAADVVSQLAATQADAPAALGVGPRAGITSEVAVLNHGQQDANLRAWHLDGARSGVRIGLIAPPGNSTVDGFGQWLARPEGKQALLDSGLRVADRAPDANRLSALGLPPEGVSETTGLSALSWGLTTQAYAAFSHRPATLTVLDMSGSMGEPFPGSSARKVDIIAQAATSSWSLWPPGSVTGLMTFNTDQQNKPHFETLMPLQSNNTPEYLAQLPEYAARFEHAQPQGGSPLYDAIWQGYEESSAQYRRDYTNTVVVLTDGRNEDSVSSLSADQLIDRIKASDPDKKINIGLVALGSESDYAELKRIADETGNRAWLVEDPRDVAEVLPQIEIAFAG